MPSGYLEEHTAPAWLIRYASDLSNIEAGNRGPSPPRLVGEPETLRVVSAGYGRLQIVADTETMYHRWVSLGHSICELTAAISDVISRSVLTVHEANLKSRMCRSALKYYAGSKARWAQVRTYLLAMCVSSWNPTVSLHTRNRPLNGCIEGGRRVKSTSTS